MAINLSDIRSSVQKYFDTKLQAEIGVTNPPLTVVGHPPNLAQFTQLTPNQQFTYKITAKNAADGGVRLVNVRYRLQVDNPSVLKLIVPEAAKATATGRPLGHLGHEQTGPPLNPGQQVDFMVLTRAPGRLPSPSSTTILEVGGSGALDDLHGVAGTAGGTTTNIKFDILADPDLDFIFPKGENGRVGASFDLKVQ